jgi:DNA (cytosine-5)-methyltransferase 1
MGDGSPRRFEMRHLDLFSGIGGFALAASWVWGSEHEIVSFVEIDPFCQKVLKKHWPETRIISDVKDIYRFAVEYAECPCGCDELWCDRHGQHFHECECVGCSQWDDEYGKPDFITAGFPCQDISNSYTTHPGGLSGLSGERSGLWYEAERIIKLLSPDFVLLENVPAIRIRGADIVLDGLEFAGYTCWPFVVGAYCAGGQTKGDRAWIVGIQKAVCEGLERHVGEVVARTDTWRQNADIARPDWGNASSRICRASDGIPHRVDRLKALGNAIVPQVAAVIMQAIKEIENG